MPDDDLTPASPDDLRDILAYALRFRRGKATQQHADLMALAAAEHMVDAMKRAGFVMMRRPPLPAHAGALPPHAPGYKGAED